MSVKKKALLSYEVVVKMSAAEVSSKQRKLLEDRVIVAQAAEVLQEVAEQDCKLPQVME